MLLSLGSFRNVYDDLKVKMRDAPQVKTERWQGADVSKDPSATSYELRNVVFEVALYGVEDLEKWRRECAPNLPWADDHFEERVGGQPLNPGKEWANWPWAKSADKFRDKAEQFNHTYMERLWPRHARQTVRGMLPIGNVGEVRRTVEHEPRHGVAWEYGDLQSIVDLLVKEPYTRMAWIPLFFPEDTGWGDGGRKPCTLGYQFLVRAGEIHIWYPLRSCDLVRHFRDDCYLGVRLLLWVLSQCRLRNPQFWNGIRPGFYSMHCTSLHVFENDKRSL
jgi:hypothetical protein